MPLPSDAFIPEETALTERLARISLLLLAILAGFSRPVHAAFNEQIAISTKAISLGNAVTADPPGLMSIHYNPAGLSLLDDGRVFSNGFTLAHIARETGFRADPDFPGFMSTWGPDTDQADDDPNSNHGGPDPLDGTSGKSSGNILYVPFYGPITLPALPAPNLGISYRDPESRWTFAYGNYAAYGGGLEHDDPDDPTRFGCHSLYLQHLVYAAPSVSYQVSDTLAVGLAVPIGQTAMGISMDQRTPNELVALTRVIGDATQDLEIPVLSELTFPPPWLGGGLGPYEHNTSLKLDMRDNFSPSINLGILWSPSRWFSWGLTYQGETESELSGDYTFTYSEQFQRTVRWNASSQYTLQGAGMLALPTNPVSHQSGAVTTIQRFPQRVQTGIMLRPVRRLKLLFDVNWAQWSVIQEDRIEFDQRIQLLQLAKILGYTGGETTMVIDRRLKDTWHWSAGAELEVTDWLKLRCGFEHRPSSLNPDLFDALYFLPENDFFGVGAGITLDNGVEIDLGLGWVLAEKVNLPNNSSSNLNSTDFTNIVYNPYAGLDYEQDTNIYIASVNVTMPFEIQIEALDHQKEIFRKVAGGVKRLFTFWKKPPDAISGKESDAS